MHRQENEIQRSAPRKTQDITKRTVAPVSRVELVLPSRDQGKLSRKLLGDPKGLDR